MPARYSFLLLLRSFAVLLAWTLYPYPTLAQSTLPETKFLHETTIRWSTASYARAVLENSPQVQQARESLKVLSARWKSELAGAALPTFSFSANAYPYGHNPSNSYRFNTWMLKRSDMSFNTGLRWNLFNSFEDMLRVRSARWSRESSQKELESELQNRTLDAFKAYYNLFLKDRLLQVAQRNLQAQQEQYLLTKDLYKHGMKSLSDLLKSETDQLSSELRLAFAEGERRMALVRFNILLNRELESPANISQELTPGATAYAPLEADLRRALLKRPEMLRSQAELERSRIQRLQALRSSLPSLAIDADWSHQDLASFGLPRSSFGIPNPNYQISLRLSLPANFNLFSQAQNILVANAEERKNIQSHEALSRNVREELYRARIELDRVIKSYQASTRKEEISKYNLELVVEQYRQGSADVIKLGQAQLDYLEAQTQRIQALHDANIQRAQYQYALGEPLWP